MDLELLAQILGVAVASGVICTQTTQFIKESGLTNKIALRIVSAIFSFMIGFLFGHSFTNLSTEYCLWIAGLSVIGAEAIYKSFEGKFGLKPLSEITSTKKEENEEVEEEIEIPR